MSKNLNKLPEKRNGIENGKSHMQFWRVEPCASAHIRFANQKWNYDELELAKEKKGEFFVSYEQSLRQKFIETDDIFKGERGVVFISISYSCYAFMDYIYL